MDTEHESLDPRLAEALTQLRDAPPAADLWKAIAPRLAPRLPRGTVAVRWPVALAAGLTIAVASVGGTMAWLDRQAPAAENTARAGNGLVVNAAFRPADNALMAAIDDLQRTLAQNVTQLSPAAQRGIAKSLAALDQAIRDAEGERRAAPNDERAADYLTATLRKKLGVLRTMSDLTSRRS